MPASTASGSSATARCRSTTATWTSTAPSAWPSAARTSPQDARRQAAEARAALAPLKKNVSRAEAEVELLSKRIAAIDRDLGDGGLYQRDPRRAQALARERG